MRLFDSVFPKGHHYETFCLHYTHVPYREDNSETETVRDYLIKPNSSLAAGLKVANHKQSGLSYACSVYTERV